MEYVIIAVVALVLGGAVGYMLFRYFLTGENKKR